MEWLDLVVPSAAILALFAAVGLVHRGHPAGACDPARSRSGSPAPATPPWTAPLQRIAELQARQACPGRGAPAGARARCAPSASIALVALVLRRRRSAGVWYLFVRGDGSAGATADAGPGHARAQRSAPRPPAPKPVDSTLVPADVPPLVDKGQYTVAVFNAQRRLRAPRRTSIAP